MSRSIAEEHGAVAGGAAAAWPTGEESISAPARWSGLVIMGFVALFLLFDGGARMVGFAPYVEGLAPLGFPERLAFPIGAALFLPTVLYLIPRTAVLGAILVTGYLGGATASQVRVEDPWFLFPVAFGVLTWLALWLRDPALRALVPMRRERANRKG